MLMSHKNKGLMCVCICVYICNNSNLHLSDYRVNSRITVFEKKKKNLQGITVSRNVDDGGLSIVLLSNVLYKVGIFGKWHIHE